MTKKSYFEKLKDPRWQRRRLEIMDRAKFLCEECGASDKTLNVHHKLYRKGADPWNYTDEELACLCEQCHEAEHHVRSRLDAALASLDIREIQMVLGFARARAVMGGEDGAADLHLESEEEAFGAWAALNIDWEGVGEMLERCQTTPTSCLRISWAELSTLRQARR